MSLIQVILLALLQGVTELFPVSSLGHTVIIPGLVGWGDLLRQDTFLPLVVTLHLGTAIALLSFFWRDWVKLLQGGMRVLVAGKMTPTVDPDGYGRQLMLVIVGTVPAGLIGVLFQRPLESLFGTPILASSFLAMNGAVLLLGERLWASQRSKQVAVAGVTGRPAPISMGAFAEGEMGRHGGHVPSGEYGLGINQMSFTQALLIGSAQTLALLPGISRSGATMAAGMSNGLSHEASARFSFLLATPIIFGAGVLEIPKLVQAGSQVLLMALGGGVLSGIAAYLSVRFLMRYFETNRMEPFAYYSVGAGTLGFLYFLLQYLHVFP